MAGFDDISPEDRDLLVNDSEWQCPYCGGEIGVVCMQTTHPDQPFPCGCTGSDHEGLCPCDMFVCQSCQRIVSRS